jgi:hypothetical protein
LLRKKFTQKQRQKEMQPIHINSHNKFATYPIVVAVKRNIAVPWMQ